MPGHLAKHSPGGEIMPLAGYLTTRSGLITARHIGV